jgi:hypothetical protein
MRTFIGGPIVAISFDYLQRGQGVSLQLSNFSERLHCAGRTLIGSTLLTVLALGAALAAVAQYPGQIKQGQQNQTMRAVAVVEWSGEEEKPKASRLVPVVLYDGEHLEDAGIYMARPAPLALSTETEYELKNNGKTTGLFVVSTAGQEQGSWVGFGAWKPLPKPKLSAPAKIDSSKDDWGNDKDDKPVLHRKKHDDSGKASSDDSGSNAPSDPDRPTLHKKSSSDDSDKSASGTDSAPSNPDLPTLHKETSDQKTSTEDSPSAGSTPVDPNRPTLKKKSDKPQQSAQTVDEGHVESVKTLSDPDRPKLLRGKPAEQGGKVLPTLVGMPSDPELHQAVAVSDAKNRPEHLWSYSWANPADEGNMKAAMEDIAREELGLNKLVQTAAPETPRAKAANARTTPASRKKGTAEPVAPAPVPLQDEQFRVFELAYSSGATMVLTARTDGEGAKQKFITLICQPNIYGKVTVLFKNVTDASRLDETPRMRLVDAVDVMANNRGELLFELRGATQRQFALYRVLRGQATRLFSTGPSSIVRDASDDTAEPHS